MSQREDDLNAEIRAHIEIETRLNMERGMTEKEARAAARRSFGSVALVQEVTREMWGRRWFERLSQDLRYALRGLGRNPGFTLIVTITMALGIGVNTALFSVVNAFIFRPPPVADPQTLYELRSPTTAGEFEYFQRHSWTLSQSAASTWVLPTLGDGGEGEIVHGNEVSADYFATLGTRAAAGRLFTAEDYRTTGGRSIVLSRSFWERAFNADPGALGRTIRLSGLDYPIVGIAEKGFDGTLPLASKFWIMMPESLEGKRSWTRMLVRMKPGTTKGQVEAELTALRRRYREMRGEPVDDDATVLLESRKTLMPMAPRTGWLIGMLMTCAGIVLLIACANVANLLLARAAARQREIAVRLSLGASRGRLLQQLLTESIVVAFAGGGAGLAAAAWLMPAVSAAVQSNLPKIWGEWAINLTPDLRVFAFTAAVCIAAGALFGLAPALQSTRPDVGSTLKDGGGQGLRWSRSRLRSGLVVAQVSLCLMLLINTGLLTRSLKNANTADPGFDTDRTLIAQLDLRQDEKQQASCGRLLERLRSVPGVEAASAGVRVPLLSAWTIVARDGRNSSASDVRTAYNHVTGDYFKTLDIPIKIGRTFTRDEDRTRAAVAVISESAARKLYPGLNPLGQVLRLDTTQTREPGINPSSLVIGVARDTRSVRLSEVDPAFVYLPMSAERLAGSCHVFVRSAGTVNELTGPLRAAGFELVRGHQLLIYPFDVAIGFQRIPAQAGAIISGVLGALALLLACVGIYGVISYAVSQRTHEIGVRMALGANHAHVVTLVIMQGMRLVGAGAAIGIIAAVPLARVLKFMLHGISPLDPWAFLGVPALLSALAVIAMLSPTLRAARLQPLVALRHD
jgi:predicted permease